MGRTETLVVSVLSILKAGGAYVPLDPSYPMERLSWIIEDSRISILLSTEEACLRMPLELQRLMVVDAGDSNTALNCRTINPFFRHGQKSRICHLYLRLHG